MERALGGDFSTDAGRYAHREVIAALLAPWFAARSTDEVTKALSQTSVLWQRYRTFEEVAADPATAANPLMRTIDQPGIGPVTVPGMPLVQPGLPDVAPAPLLGADTEALLSPRGDDPPCRPPGKGGRPPLTPFPGERAQPARPWASPPTGLGTTPGHTPLAPGPPRQPGWGRPPGTHRSPPASPPTGLGTTHGAYGPGR